MNYDEANKLIAELKHECHELRKASLDRAAQICKLDEIIKKKDQQQSKEKRRGDRLGYKLNAANTTIQDLRSANHALHVRLYGAEGLVDKVREEVAAKAETIEVMDTTLARYYSYCEQQSEALQAKGDPELIAYELAEELTKLEDKFEIAQSAVEDAQNQLIDEQTERDLADQRRAQMEEARDESERILDVRTKALNEASGRLESILPELSPIARLAVVAIGRKVQDILEGK